MYQVMVVDDEPAAVNLIRTVVEKKIDRFTVSDTAYDEKKQWKR